MLDWQKKLKKIISGKEICLVGFGREGQSTLKALRSAEPKIKVAIIDSKTGPDYLQDLKKYNFIIRAPGVPIKLIKKYASVKVLITSQTKLFFDLSPAKIIGVTGTKGKSTTASLIAGVLKQKFNVQLVGNIGRPPLDYLDKLKPDSLVVFEISSHQLSDLTRSPQIAVMMNLFPEHLDYYSDFEEYAVAKKNITEFQTKKDLLIYNLADKKISQIAGKSLAKKISFGLNVKSGADCYVDGDYIYFKRQPIFPIEKSPIVGEFNLVNLMPAVIIGKQFKIKDELIVKAITTFKPLPHRLEVAGKVKGITFINDSLATAPRAAMSAIKAFKDSLGTLIVGGYDRGLDQRELAKTIVEEKVPIVIVFPTTGEKIAKAIERNKKTVIKIFRADNMREAVSLAKRHTPKGKTCLMSPGAASFNMFKDYQDRGEQFKAAVKKL